MSTYTLYVFLNSMCFYCISCKCRRWWLWFRVVSQQRTQKYNISIHTPTTSSVEWLHITIRTTKCRSTHKNTMLQNSNISHARWQVLFLPLLDEDEWARKLLFSPKVRNFLPFSLLLYAAALKPLTPSSHQQLSQNVTCMDKIYTWYTCKC